MGSGLRRDDRLGEEEGHDFWPLMSFIQENPALAAVVIRNLPEATHRALKRRAKAHGRSTEAEIRDILETALSPAEGAATGKEIFDALHALGQEFGGIELEIPPRTEPARAVKFE